jgi:TolA-binding protein
MKKIVFLFIGLLFATTCIAQEQLLNMGIQYLNEKNYPQAETTFKQLLTYSPDDMVLLDYYYKSLMPQKNFKEAEKVIKAIIKKSNAPDTLQFKLANFYQQKGDTKKANNILEKLIKKTPEDIDQALKLAKQFEKAGMVDNAITVLEKTTPKHEKNNPYLFAEELAVLYDKKGDYEKGSERLLDVYVSAPDKQEDIKATFLKMLNTASKTEDLRKKIMKRIGKDEMNMLYPDLLAWIYIQQKDYESAFIQIKSIDLRLQENGRRIIGFARMALREMQYNAAIEAYNYIIDTEKESSYYKLALSEKLTALKSQLESNATYTKQDVLSVEQAYEKTITDFPAFNKEETIREYAQLEAMYVHNIDKAVEILKNVTEANNVDKQFRARCKLDMGDYELIRGNKWESTLLYSQVDKEFKQDMLGEEARFRNAKLSYYTGDFTWAQGQLDVLKASTSELIANDALDLSVLITENNPIKDSNVTPLEMFARASLYQFQNKNDEAILVLDSIKKEYPQHPLIDNIYMERASMAANKHEYNEAAMYYQKVVTEFSDEILADDATFKLATINETIFKNKDEALRLYETIITKYPGSSFVTEARKNFRRLRGDDIDNGM